MQSNGLSKRLVNTSYLARLWGHSPTAKGFERDARGDFFFTQPGPARPCVPARLGCGRHPAGRALAGARSQKLHLQLLLRAAAESLRVHELIKGEKYEKSSKVDTNKVASACSPLLL